MHAYNYSKSQLFWLVTLRVLIGWYFLYEGLAKVFTTGWTAYGYLLDSKGVFAPMFEALAENPDLLHIANIINNVGLIAIGLSLLLGAFGKIGHWGAIVLLVLYYISHPPLIDVKYMLPPEGSYLWVDKNLVMLGATIVSMVFPTSKIIGLDRVIFKNKKK